jgi:MFS family permease
MVTSRELLTANVMMFSTRFLQYTLGAAMGGVTAAQFGYNVAFLVNSLSFIASAVFILLIPETVMRKVERKNKEEAGEIDPLSAESCVSAPIAGSEQPVETVSFFKDLREGLSYVWVTPFVRGIILLNVGWATGGGMVNLLFDQMGAHTFAHDDLGDWNVSALFAASGAGLFIGMMLARRAGAWATEERRAGLFIGWSLVTQGMLLSVAGLMPSLALMAVFVAAARLILGAEFGVQETFMMRVLPDEYRGRVFTTDRSLELSMMAIATVASGWLIKWLGPRAVMVISGVLSASPGVVWLLALSLTDFRVPSRAVRESFGD